MYRGQHRDERLFRPSARGLRWLSTVVATAVKDRHLPAHTGRRTAVAVGVAVALLAAPVLVPVSTPGPDEVRASTPVTPVDPASTPSPAGAAVPATDAAVPDAPALRPPLPAAPLMATAPPLPPDRARSGRALLLTFDDGPDPRWTPQVLALLKGYGARAVFCVVGRKAQQHPELINAIVSGGHDLCNHTTTHDEDIALKPGAAVRADLAATQAIIREITGGIAPRFMRAPGGRWSSTLLGEAEVLGLAPLDWSVDPRDWSKPGLRHIVDTVLRDARPGGVVVLHDGGGDRTQTLLALGYLMRRLRQLGYDFR